MDIELVKLEIIEECIYSENGLLVQLHSLATFDDARYRMLMDNILVYIEWLGDSKQIDRDIAGCLFLLIEVLTTALSSVPSHKPDYQKAQDAHYEVWTLLNEKLYVFPSRE